MDDVLANSATFKELELFPWKKASTSWPCWTKTALNRARRR